MSSGVRAVNSAIELNQMCADRDWFEHQGTFPAGGQVISSSPHLLISALDATARPRKRGFQFRMAVGRVLYPRLLVTSR